MRGAVLVGTPEEASDRLRRWVGQLSGAGAMALVGEEFGNQLREALGIDFFNPRGVDQPGLDLGVPAAGWWDREGWVFTVGATDEEVLSKSFSKILGITSKLPGRRCRVERVTLGGRPQSGCVDEGKVRLGLSVREGRLWIVGGGTPAQLDELLRRRGTLRDSERFRRLPVPDAAMTLWGQVLPGIWDGTAHIALEPDTGELAVRGNVTRERVPLGEGPAPFAGLENMESILVLRARISSDLPLLEEFSPASTLSGVCSRCRPGSVKQLLGEIESVLTGDTALIVRELDPRCCTGSKVKARDLFFLVRHAWVAVVNDEAKAREVVGRIARLFAEAGMPARPSARRTPGMHLVAQLPQDAGDASREVHFGVASGILYVGSDGLAVDSAYSVGPAPGGASLSLRLDPAVLGEELSELEALPEEVDLRTRLFRLTRGLGVTTVRTDPIWLKAWPEGDRIRLEARVPTPRKILEPDGP